MRINKKIIISKAVATTLIIAIVLSVFWIMSREKSYIPIGTAENDDYIRLSEDPFLLYNEDGIILYVAIDKENPTILSIKGENSSGKNLYYFISAESVNKYLLMSTIDYVNAIDLEFYNPVQGAWRTEEGMKYVDGVKFTVHLYDENNGDELWTDSFVFSMELINKSK